MQYNLKMCRICAKIAKTSALQTTLFERGRKEMLRKIALVTGVSLRNSKNLPQQICLECETDLQQSFAFRERCINAQTYFASAAYKKQSMSTATTKAAADRSSNSRTDLTHKDGMRVRMRREQAAYSTETAEQEPNAEDEYKQLQLNVELEEESEIYLKSESCADEAAKAELLMLPPSNNAVICDEVEMFLPQATTEYSVEATNNAGALEIVRLECRSADQTTYKTCSSKPIEIEILDSENEVEKLCKKATDALVRKRRKYAIKKERIFICDQCGNNFKCRQHLQTHLKRHAGVKPFQCEVCPDKFFTHSELTRHMRRHTGERPFACKYCERRFTDYSTRVKHERTHTNERPFACNQCDKAFTTSYILKNHMLVHTGERSFECTYCARSFQRQTHLIVHNRSIMHQHNVEKAEQELSKQPKTLAGTFMRLPMVI